MWNELTLKQQISEVFTCVAFVAFVALVCFMPDLAGI